MSLLNSSVPKTAGGVKPNDRAKQLQIADARVYVGPQFKDAFMLVVPSPVYLPEAAARWRGMGGRFDDSDPLLPLWRIPRRNVKMTLKELDDFYRALYPLATRDAVMRLGLSNQTLCRQVKEIVKARQTGGGQ